MPENVTRYIYNKTERKLQGLAGGWDGGSMRSSHLRLGDFLFRRHGGGLGLGQHWHQVCIEVERRHRAHEKHAEERDQLAVR